MEEILSSIKRIIEEEGEVAVTSARSRRSARASAAARVDPCDDEVLELNDAVAAPGEIPGGRPLRAVEKAIADTVGSRNESARSAQARVDAKQADQPTVETIVSAKAAEASRGALETLSRLVVRPQSDGTDTLEGLVREMLRPMLKDWLDANLPQMVEAMVAREIARITGRD